MKKSFLLILMIAALMLTSRAQVFNSWNFEDQQMSSWSPWSPATAAVVANPAPTGNTSAYVLEYNQTAEAWKGVAHWQDPTILNADVKTISVDVYIVGKTGLLQLYMDNSTSGAPSSANKQFKNIPADTWTTATFDVSDIVVLDFKQFAFQCDVKGIVYLDNIQLLGAKVPVSKVIARETFGTTNYDTNNPKPQASGWGSGVAWHFDWTDVTSFTSTNGYITSGSDSSIRIQTYNDMGAKPDDWREPSTPTTAHMAIRTDNAYKGSWDTLYYGNIDISSSYSVTAIEFGYARARTVVDADTTHRSLNVEYRIDGGGWMQLDTSLILPANVFKKWDYIVMPVNITGKVLDIRFACIRPNEQIYIDDITIVASVPPYELMEAVITRETFGTTNYDTNNPKPQASGWGGGTAWHFDWTDVKTFTSTNGYITSGSDSSVRIQTYNDMGAKPDDWREPSTPTTAHMAIRTDNAYKGSWDTLCFTGIDISSAFSVTAVEFGYARARTVVDADTLHRSLNVEYRVDGGNWVQLDTSLIIPANVFKKWDYIVLPVNVKGKTLDVRFACIQPNEQIYIDDITVVGKVAAPDGINDFVVENIVVGTVDSPADYTCNLNISWDTDNVNLFLDITDDSIVNTGTSYQVDNIEVYFDMDNSKNIHWPRNGGWVASDPTYDANDYQLRLVPGVEFSVNNSFKGAIQVYTQTATGYTFELTIPWDSLMDGFEPAIGTQIGFDILASDNDAIASDANRNQITLVSPTANPYNDPSLFGTLQFEGMGTFNIIPDEEVPGIATNLKATADKKNVTLSWDNATDNIAILYYNIYQGTTLIKEKVYPKETGNTFAVKDLADGNYAFSLETVDNSGNISASKASVSVTIKTTSVNDLNSRVSVYPNPVLNELNIRGIDNIVKVEVIGVTGNVVKMYKGSSVINVSELSRGAYILKIQSNNEVLTTRFLKN